MHGPCPAWFCASSTARATSSPPATGAASKPSTVTVRTAATRTPGMTATAPATINSNRSGCPGLRSPEKVTARSAINSAKSSTSVTSTAPPNRWSRPVAAVCRKRYGQRTATTRAVDVSCTSMAADGVVRLDDAFLRLRRLWSASRQRIVHTDGGYVEMSTLLVVEACAQAAQGDRLASVAGVAVFADVVPSTASRLVDRAVTAGYVQRVLPPDRERRSVLQLTAAGESLHQMSLAARLRWLQQQLDGWPPGAVDDLAYLLTRFADTLDGSIAAQP